MSEPRPSSGQSAAPGSFRVLRVVVFGPESTGKTTLARRLAEHFQEPWSTEFVRTYWDEHKGDIGPDDLVAIGEGQLQAELAAEAAARRIVFFDTDMLTCTLWDDLLFQGHCPEWVRTEAERRSREVSLYLLCGTDIPFEPDPQRCFPDPAGRAMCMRLWRGSLANRNLPFIELLGSFDQRFATARAAVEALLARPPAMP